MRKSLKNIFNCCKLQVVFKYRNKLDNNVHLKAYIPTNLTSGVIYNLQCRLCSESYCRVCVRYLNVKFGEHICISPLTKKQAKFKNSSVANHFLFWNHSSSYDDFFTPRVFIIIEREPVNTEINHLWIGTLQRRLC